MATLREDQQIILTQLEENFNNSTNVLVAAPTGWGKTFLCANVVISVKEKAPNKLTIIIEPTVVLVQQVCKRFKKSFVGFNKNFGVGFFYGSMKKPVSVKSEDHQFPDKQHDPALDKKKLMFLDSSLLLFFYLNRN